VEIGVEVITAHILAKVEVDVTVGGVVVATTGLGYAVRIMLEAQPKKVNDEAMKISEGK